MHRTYYTIHMTLTSIELDRKFMITGQDRTMVSYAYNYLIKKTKSFHFLNVVV